jgi:hypothetical protein
MVFSKITALSQKRVENISEFVKRFVTFEELSLYIDEMLSNLRFGVRADTFEKALNDLAFALGFVGQRPDKEWKAGPDNLWGLRDDEYMLFECKSEVRTDRADINKDETGQINNASAWFKQHYSGAKVKRILIIPTKTLSKGAGFNDEVEIMRQYSLRRLTKSVKAFFNEFSNLDFANLAESKVQSFIDAHNLDVQSLLTEYSEQPKSY